MEIKSNSNNSNEKRKKIRVAIKVWHFCIIIFLFIIIALQFYNSEKIEDYSSEKIEELQNIAYKVDEKKNIYMNTSNLDVNRIMENMLLKMQAEKNVVFETNHIYDFYNFSTAVNMHMDEYENVDYKTLSSYGMDNVFELMEMHQLAFFRNQSCYNVELIEENENYIVIAKENSITEKYYINKNTELLEKVEIVNSNNAEQNSICNVEYIEFEIPEEIPEEMKRKRNSFKDIEITGLTENAKDTTAKPVIYIYPETKTKVEVKLGNPEKLTTVYPEYKDGWKVIANPDGTLENIETGREYYCLYWEGKNDIPFEYKEGFVVKGEDTVKFLEEKLEILGLNEKEAQEFIIYWLPQMEDNNYNYIRFQTKDEIEQDMPLEIIPEPETTIRVMMEWKALDEEIEVKEEQRLEKVERKGYTVVEWGGSERK